MLEGICKHKYSRRSKSNEIAWLIKQEWEWLQEQEQEKTPAEMLEIMKANFSRLEKKVADYVAPCYDKRIIQFPQVRQFLGST
jgi:hypothetical protein